MFPLFCTAIARFAFLPATSLGIAPLHRFCTSTKGGAIVTGAEEAARLSDKFVSPIEFVESTFATRKNGPSKPVGQLNRGIAIVACLPGFRLIFLVNERTLGAPPGIDVALEEAYTSIVI